MRSVKGSEEAFFEELFHRRYKDLLISAKAMIRKYGVKGLDVESRAEEAVQETMYEAWKHSADVMQKEDPFLWLCGILKNKVYEQIRQDSKWIRNLMHVPLPKDGADPAEFYEKSELRDVLTAEEYAIMLKIYHEGYSYEELSRELGISKTNLATKIYRIKQRARKIL